MTGKWEPQDSPFREDIDKLQDEEKKKRKLQQRQLELDYEEVFSTRAGKHVFNDILNRCHIFHSTFTGNSRGMFLEGERNIGLYILSNMYAPTDSAKEAIDALKREQEGVQHE